MLRLKNLLYKLLSQHLLLKDAIITRRFSQTLTGTGSSGFRTFTITYPDGYIPLGFPYMYYITGNETCYITDINYVNITNTSLTISYYAHIPVTASIIAVFNIFFIRTDFKTSVL